MNERTTSLLLTSAKQALHLKREIVARELRKMVTKDVHIKQYRAAEEELSKTIARVIGEEVEAIAVRLGALGVKSTKDATDTAASLIPQVFDQSAHKRALIDAVLPVMAVKMAEAGTASLIALGIDPRIKSVKHLQGQHNQQDHAGGRGFGEMEFSSEEQSKRLISLVLKQQMPKTEIDLEEGTDKVDFVGYYENQHWEDFLRGGRMGYYSIQDEDTPFLTESAGAIIRHGMPGSDVQDFGRFYKTKDDLQKAWKFIKEKGYEAYLEKLLPEAGEVDWRPPEMVPEDYYVSHEPSTKMTTASEWLEQNPDVVESLSEVLIGFEDIPIGIWTEIPPWMQKSIAQSLKDSFSQPYWDNIAATTGGDAAKALEEGLSQGWSIRKIAKEMIPSLGGDDYARVRAFNIARTESGNALNGARSASYNQLMKDLPELKMRPTWLSVLGNTTRPTHADQDGVPADADGMWELGGVKVPWPGHYNLPASERCNCQCTVDMDYGISEVTAQQLIQDYYNRVYKSAKHLQGQHNQLSHARGGGMGKVLASVEKHTGYNKEQIKDALTGDVAPTSAVNKDRAKKRAKIIGSIYAGGNQKKNAIMDVLDNDTKEGTAALIKSKKTGQGNEAVPLKEMGGLPAFDINVISTIKVAPGHYPGDGVCNMATRSIAAGEQSMSGTWRHEAGHAVRSSLGGDNYTSKRVITKALAKEYEDVKQRVKKDPAGVKKKLSHEWYEDNYGVAGKRSLDNWEENFAEHYRLYHREVHRDRNEGGGGKHLAKYRERHPGMTEIFDAYYTAASLGQELEKGNVKSAKHLQHNQMTHGRGGGGEQGFEESQVSNAWIDRGKRGIPQVGETQFTGSRTGSRNEAKEFVKFSTFKGTLYHGSRDPDTIEDEGIDVSSDEVNLTPGISLAFERNYAEDYVGDDGKVFEVKVDIRKPVRSQDPKVLEEVRKRGLDDVADFDKVARDMGYDAWYGPGEVRVFVPEQVFVIQD